MFSAEHWFYSSGIIKTDMAEPLYRYILKKAQEYVPVVEHGLFGADMEVSLLNDGPFTIILDSDELFS